MAQTTNTESKYTTSIGSQKTKAGFVFKKANYQLLVASIAVVAIGYLLMIGTTDIYSFTKITLAPIVVILGFAIGFAAILYKPKK